MKSTMRLITRNIDVNHLWMLDTKHDINYSSISKGEENLNRVTQIHSPFLTKLRGQLILLEMK